MLEFMQKRIDGRLHGLVVLAAGVAISLSANAASAVTSDITISFDMFGFASETTFEVRDGSGVLIDSGTFTPAFLDCGIAGDLVAAINPTPPTISVTDETPDVCGPTDGGNVRVTMGEPGECRVCSGPGPCGPGDILGETPKDVGSLTFSKETSLPSASPPVLIGLTVALFVAGSAAIGRMRGSEAARHGRH